MPTFNEGDKVYLRRWNGTLVKCVVVTTHSRDGAQGWVTLLITATGDCTYAKGSIVRVGVNQVKSREGAHT